MNFKQILSSKAYWKSVLGLGVLFNIVYNSIAIFFEYGSFNVSQYFQERTANGKWVMFAVTQLLATLAYGMIVAYGQFKKKDKK